jgi:calcineurin-like phosphoesterase family protein
MKKVLIIIIILCNTVFIFNRTFDGTLKSLNHRNTNAQERMGYNENKKYALLIGGGSNQHDICKSYYKNIEYVFNTLKILSYDDKDIKILFYGGRTPDHPIVEGDATKTSVMKELSYIGGKIDSNDTLIIFRSGHGIIESMFFRAVHRDSYES